MAWAKNQFEELFGTQPRLAQQLNEEVTAETKERHNIEEWLNHLSEDQVLPYLIPIVYLVICRFVSILFPILCAAYFHHLPILPILPIFSYVAYFAYFIILMTLLFYICIDHITNTSS